MAGVCVSFCLKFNDRHWYLDISICEFKACVSRASTFLILYAFVFLFFALWIRVFCHFRCARVSFSTDMLDISFRNIFGGSMFGAKSKFFCPMKHFVNRLHFKRIANAKEKKMRAARWTEFSTDDQNNSDVMYVCPCPYCPCNSIYTILISVQFRIRQWWMYEHVFVPSRFAILDRKPIQCLFTLNCTRINFFLMLHCDQRGRFFFVSSVPFKSKWFVFFITEQTA